MRQVVAYGIDYGTSNSSVAAVYDDGVVEVLPVQDGDTALRSLVHLHRDGTRLAGDDAVRAYLVDGAAHTRCGRCELVDRRPDGIFTLCRQYAPGSRCQDSRLLAQVKTDLASDGLDRTHSWSHDFLFTDLVATTLRRLKREADRHTGQDVRRLVLGHPVRFPGTASDPVRLQVLAEARLQAAAAAAGFHVVALVPEPQAAVTLEEVDDGVIVCTDFGGGTFDVAVLEKTASRGQILALRGVAVGGEDFDSRIFDLKMHAALGLDRTVTGADGSTLGLPNWMRREFRSLSGLKRLLTDNSVAVLLRELAAREGGGFAETLSELLYGGQAYACYRAIEQAKIALSQDDRARITVQRPPFLDIDLELTREELESLIATDMRKVRLCVEDALDDAGVRGEDVLYVTRTGGSSRIPAFQSVLHAIFDEDRIVQRDAFTTVVSGLAAYGYEEWGGAA